MNKSSVNFYVKIVEALIKGFFSLTLEVCKKCCFFGLSR